MPRGLSIEHSIILSLPANLLVTITEYNNQCIDVNWILTLQVNGGMTLTVAQSGVRPVLSNISGQQPSIPGIDLEMSLVS